MHPERWWLTLTNWTVTCSNAGVVLKSPVSFYELIMASWGSMSSWESAFFFYVLFSFDTHSLDFVSFLSSHGHGLTVPRWWSGTAVVLLHFPHLELILIQSQMQILCIKVLLFHFIAPFLQSIKLFVVPFKSPLQVCSSDLQVPTHLINDLLCWICCVVDDYSHFLGMSPLSVGRSWSNAVGFVNRRGKGPAKGRALAA